MCVDTERLESLFGMIGERLAKVLNSFASSGASNLQLMRSSIDEGDFESLSRAAHSLKGSAANYGAATLQALCEDLEHASVASLPEDIEARCLAIKDEFVRVELRVREWRATKGI